MNAALRAWLADAPEEAAEREERTRKRGKVA
jgi:hypothetical protein